MTHPWGFGAAPQVLAVEWVGPGGAPRGVPRFCARPAADRAHRALRALPAGEPRGGRRGLLLFLRRPVALLLAAVHGLWLRLRPQQVRVQQLRPGDRGQVPAEGKRVPPAPRLSTAKAAVSVPHPENRGEGGAPRRAPRRAGRGGTSWAAGLRRLAAVPRPAHLTADLSAVAKRDGAAGGRPSSEESCPFSRMLLVRFPSSPLLRSRHP